MGGLSEEFLKLVERRMTVLMRMYMKVCATCETTNMKVFHKRLCLVIKGVIVGLYIILLQ